MLIIKIITYWFLASAAMLVFLWIISEIEQAWELRSYRKQARQAQKSTLSPEDLITIIEASERVHAEERAEIHST